MGFDEVQQVLAEASIVICHAGTGSLITALRQSCHVIAVPRLHALGEVYDDHQEQIAAEFESRGLIQVARTTEELAAALREVRRREPVTATTDQTEMIQFLRQHLANMTPRPRVHDPISLS
jgi:UDP-N-acetylglucosamine transferase subunit ALG13